MPTSFKNSPYFLCHYGVKGRSGKAGAGLWYKNGQLTEEGYRHYYMQKYGHEPSPEEVKNRSNSESLSNNTKSEPINKQQSSNNTTKPKDSRYYEKRKNEYANKAARMAVHSFVAGVAARSLNSALKKSGGNSGKGLTSLLATVSSAYALGAGISSSAYTAGWAYNSLKKREVSRNKKRKA